MLLLLNVFDIPGILLCQVNRSLCMSIIFIPAFVPIHKIPDRSSKTEVTLLLKTEKSLFGSIIKFPTALVYLSKNPRPLSTVPNQINPDALW